MSYSAEHPSTHTYDPLIEAGLTMFAESKLPEYESVRGDEAISTVALEAVRTAALVYAPIITKNGETLDDKQRYDFAQKYTIPSAAAILDREAPMKPVRRGDMWPDTYELVLKGSGTEELARQIADEPVTWAGWIRRTAQDVVLGVYPPQE
jgi:hypothetical protein